MNDSQNDSKSPTQSPNVNINFEIPQRLNRTQSETDIHGSEITEGAHQSGTKRKTDGDLIKIVGGVVSIGTIIFFLVSLIITQIIIVNGIDNVQKELVNVRSAIEVNIKSFEDNFNYFRDNTKESLTDISERLKKLENDVNNINE